MKRILVFGVFDGIHEGHGAFLRQARKCGDVLIVAVTRDGVAENLKGRRPRKDQGLRIKELLETGLVDKVVEGDDTLGSWDVIGKVKPDGIALGYDQGVLKDALEKYIREGGLQIEVKVMEAYRPEEMHSSLLNDQETRYKKQNLNIEI